MESSAGDVNVDDTMGSEGPNVQQEPLDLTISRYLDDLETSKHETPRPMLRGKRILKLPRLFSPEEVKPGTFSVNFETRNAEMPKENEQEKCVDAQMELSTVSDFIEPRKDHENLVTSSSTSKGEEPTEKLITNEEVENENIDFKETRGHNENLEQSPVTSKANKPIEKQLNINGEENENVESNKPAHITEQHFVDHDKDQEKCDPEQPTDEKGEELKNSLHSDSQEGCDRSKPIFEGNEDSKKIEEGNVNNETNETVPGPLFDATGEGSHENPGPLDLSNDTNELTVQKSEKNYLSKPNGRSQQSEQTSSTSFEHQELERVQLLAKLKSQLVTLSSMMMDHEPSDNPPSCACRQHCEEDSNFTEDLIRQTILFGCSHAAADNSLCSSCSDVYEHVLKFAKTCDNGGLGFKADKTLLNEAIIETLKHRSELNDNACSESPHSVSAVPGADSIAENASKGTAGNKETHCGTEGCSCRTPPNELSRLPSPTTPDPSTPQQREDLPEGSPSVDPPNASQQNNLNTSNCSGDSEVSYVTSNAIDIYWEDMPGCTFPYHLMIPDEYPDFVDEQLQGTSAIGPYYVNMGGGLSFMFAVAFDRMQPTFWGGETMRGHVYLCCRKDLPLNNLLIRFSGGLRLFPKRHKTPDGKNLPEAYICEKQVLCLEDGDLWRAEGSRFNDPTTVLPAGMHHFPWNLHVRSNLYGSSSDGLIKVLYGLSLDFYSGVIPGGMTTLTFTNVRILTNPHLQTSFNPDPRIVECQVNCPMKDGPRKSIKFNFKVHLNSPRVAVNRKLELKVELVDNLKHVSTFLHYVQPSISQELTILNGKEETKTKIYRANVCPKMQYTRTKEPGQSITITHTIDVGNITPSTVTKVKATTLSHLKVSYYLELNAHFPDKSMRLLRMPVVMGYCRSEPLPPYPGNDKWLEPNVDGQYRTGDLGYDELVTLMNDCLESPDTGGGIVTDERDESELNEAMYLAFIKVLKDIVPKPSTSEEVEVRNHDTKVKKPMSKKQRKKLFKSSLAKNSRKKEAKSLKEDCLALFQAFSDKSLVEKEKDMANKRALIKRCLEEHEMIEQKSGEFFLESLLHLVPWKPHHCPSAKKVPVFFVCSSSNFGVHIVSADCPPESNCVDAKSLSFRVQLEVSKLVLKDNKDLLYMLADENRSLVYYEDQYFTGTLTEERCTHVNCVYEQCVYFGHSGFPVTMPVFLGNCKQLEESLKNSKSAGTANVALYNKGHNKISKCSLSPKELGLSTNPAQDVKAGTINELECNDRSKKKKKGNRKKTKQSSKGKCVEVLTQASCDQKDGEEIGSQQRPLNAQISGKTGSSSETNDMNISQRSTVNHADEEKTAIKNRHDPHQSETEVAITPENGDHLKDVDMDDTRERIETELYTSSNLFTKTSSIDLKGPSIEIQNRASCDSGTVTSCYPQTVHTYGTQDKRTPEGFETCIPTEHHSQKSKISDLGTQTTASVDITPLASCRTSDEPGIDSSCDLDTLTPSDLESQTSCNSSSRRSSDLDSSASESVERQDYLVPIPQSLHDPVAQNSGDDHIRADGNPDEPDTHKVSNSDTCKSIHKEKREPKEIENNNASDPETSNASNLETQKAIDLEPRNVYDHEAAERYTADSGTVKVTHIDKNASNSICTQASTEATSTGFSISTQTIHQGPLDVEEPVFVPHNNDQTQETKTIPSANDDANRKSSPPQSKPEKNARNKKAKNKTKKKKKKNQTSTSLQENARTNDDAKPSILCDREKTEGSSGAAQVITCINNEPLLQREVEGISTCDDGQIVDLKEVISCEDAGGEWVVQRSRRSQKKVKTPQKVDQSDENLLYIDIFDFSNQNDESISTMTYPLDNEQEKEDVDIDTHERIEMKFFQTSSPLKQNETAPGESLSYADVVRHIEQEEEHQSLTTETSRWSLKSKFQKLGLELESLSEHKKNAIDFSSWYKDWRGCSKSSNVNSENVDSKKKKTWLIRDVDGSKDAYIDPADLYEESKKSKLDVVNIAMQRSQSLDNGRLYQFIQKHPFGTEEKQEQDKEAASSTYLPKESDPNPSICMYSDKPTEDRPPDRLEMEDAVGRSILSNSDDTPLDEYQPHSSVSSGGSSTTVNQDNDDQDICLEKMFPHSDEQVLRNESLPTHLAQECGRVPQKETNEKTLAETNCERASQRNIVESHLLQNNEICCLYQRDYQLDSLTDKKTNSEFCQPVLTISTKVINESNMPNMLDTSQPKSQTDDSLLLTEWKNKTEASEKRNGESEETSDPLPDMAIRELGLGKTSKEVSDVFHETSLLTFPSLYDQDVIIALENKENISRLTHESHSFTEHEIDEVFVTKISDEKTDTVAVLKETTNKTPGQQNGNPEEYSQPGTKGDESEPPKQLLSVANGVIRAKKARQRRSQVVAAFPLLASRRQSFKSDNSESFSKETESESESCSAPTCQAISQFLQRAKQSSNNAGSTVSSSITSVALRSNKADAGVLNSNAGDEVLSSKADEAVLSSKADEAVLSSKADNAVLSSKAENAVLNSKADNAVLSSEADDDVLSNDVDDAVPNSKLENAVPSSKEDGTFPSTEVDGAIPSSKVDDAILSSKVDDAVSSSKVENAVPNSKIENAVPSSKVDDAIPSSKVDDADIVVSSSKVDSVVPISTGGSYFSSNYVDDPASISMSCRTIPGIKIDDAISSAKGGDAFQKSVIGDAFSSGSNEHFNAIDKTGGALSTNEVGDEFPSSKDGDAVSISLVDDKISISGTGDNALNSKEGAADQIGKKCVFQSRKAGTVGQRNAAGDTDQRSKVGDCTLSDGFGDDVPSLKSCDWVKSYKFDIDDLSCRLGNAVSSNETGKTVSSNNHFDSDTSSILQGDTIPGSQIDDAISSNRVSETVLKINKGDTVLKSNSDLVSNGKAGDSFPSSPTCEAHINRKASSAILKSNTGASISSSQTREAVSISKIEKSAAISQGSNCVPNTTGDSVLNRKTGDVLPNSKVSDVSSGKAIVASKSSEADNTDLSSHIVNVVSTSQSGSTCFSRQAAVVSSSEVGGALSSNTSGDNKMNSTASIATTSCRPGDGISIGKTSDWYSQNNMNIHTLAHHEDKEHVTQNPKCVTNEVREGETPKHRNEVNPPKHAEKTKDVPYNRWENEPNGFSLLQHILKREPAASDQQTNGIRTRDPNAYSRARFVHDNLSRALSLEEKFRVKKTFEGATHGGSPPRCENVTKLNTNKMLVPETDELPRQKTNNAFQNHPNHCSFGRRPVIEEHIQRMKRLASWDKASSPWAMWPHNGIWASGYEFDNAEAAFDSPWTMKGPKQTQPVTHALNPRAPSFRPGDNSVDVECNTLPVGSPSYTENTSYQQALRRISMLEKSGKHYDKEIRIDIPPSDEFVLDGMILPAHRLNSSEIKERVRPNLFQSFMNDQSKFSNTSSRKTSHVETNMPNQNSDESAFQRDYIDFFFQSYNKNKFSQIAEGDRFLEVAGWKSRMEPHRLDQSNIRFQKERQHSTSTMASQMTGNVFSEHNPRMHQNVPHSGAMMNYIAHQISKLSHNPKGNNGILNEEQRLNAAPVLHSYYQSRPVRQSNTFNKTIPPNNYNGYFLNPRALESKDTIRILRRPSLNEENAMPFPIRATKRPTQAPYVPPPARAEQVPPQILKKPQARVLGQFPEQLPFSQLDGNAPPHDVNTDLSVLPQPQLRPGLSSKFQKAALYGHRTRQKAWAQGWLAQREAGANRTKQTLKVDKVKKILKRPVGLAQLPLSAQPTRQALGDQVGNIATGRFQRITLPDGAIGIVSSTQNGN